MSLNQHTNQGVGEKGISQQPSDLTPPKYFIVCKKRKTQQQRLMMTRQLPSHRMLILSLLLQVTQADNIFSKFKQRLARKKDAQPPQTVEEDAFDPKYGKLVLWVAFTATIISILHLFPNRQEVEVRISAEGEDEAEKNKTL